MITKIETDFKMNKYFDTKENIVFSRSIEK